jgi:hypothetical protein
MTLYDYSTGEVRVVYTNTFGYYSFKDAAVNDLFEMSVQHSRYRFVNGSVSFTLRDNIDGMNFQASR